MYKKMKFGILLILVFLISCTEESRLFKKLQNLYDKQNFKEIINFYNENSTTISNSSEILNTIAMSYSKIGEQDMAIKIIEKAISLDYNETIYHSNLSHFLIEKKDYVQGAISAQESIEIDPSNFYGHFNLSVSYIKLYKWDLSLEPCQKAINLDASKTEIGDAYANLAIIYVNLQNDSLGYQNALKAIDLNGGCTYSHNAKAFVLAKNQKIDKALQEATKSLKFDSLNYDPMYLKGLILIKTNKDVEKGCQMISRSIQLAKEDDYINCDKMISIYTKYCK